MTSLYIHIPFCKRKCDYCDFVSYAGKEDLLDQYVGALFKESQALTPHPSPSTIYIGGGTPTLLSVEHFEKILGALLITEPSALEITVEANPGTADKKKLKALKELGVNRLSIGAQTFNDHHLKTLGRIHNSADIFRFYEDARSAGFENINLDLIFAIPGQTLDEWKSDLKTAISLNPNHLSTYNLTIEEGTRLYEEITNNKSLGAARDAEPVEALQITNNETEATMFEYSIDALIAAGYKHYEISNFARPGFECRHNLNYWKNGNYIGLGAGAHSHVNGKRWANPSSIKEYIGCGSVRRNVLRRAPDDSPDATDQRETLFLGLRLIDGLAIDHFAGFDEEVGQLLKEGLLQRNNGHYRLTRRGIMLGNQVFSRFV
jgi:oxygen-independent coproporphyrinogen-3 oxidase